MSLTRNTSLSQICFATLALSIAFLFISAASHATDAVDTSDAQLPGMICVNVAESAIPRLIAEIRKSGGKAKRREDDLHCHGDGHAISIPEGLETWTIATLRRLGYANVHPGGATAGGSGDVRVLLDRAELTASLLTGPTLPRAKAEIECKITSAIKRNFDYVSVYPCKQVDFEDGLCWNIRVLGHTSKSPALRPSNLNGIINNKYWVRAKIEVWMGEFASTKDQNDDNQGRKVKIHMSVYSSEYARFPSSILPENSQYRPISHYDPTVAIDELDEVLNVLNEHFMNLIFKSRLACDQT
jgi:hypothetical protein